MATNLQAASFVDVVSPTASSDNEGNSALGLIGQLPTHFQQVYLSSEFQDVLPLGGALLRGVAFRTDGPLGFNVATVLTNLQIVISTTPQTPDHLSIIFADNLGPNAMTVFGPANRPFGAAHGPFVGNPMPLDGSISFTTPFFYNPAAGNLLLDIRTFSNNGPVSLFDAVDIRGDTVSSVTSFNGDLAAGQADTRGLVTDLNFVFVPEPAPLALLTMALACLWLFARRKRNQTS